MVVSHVCTLVNALVGTRKHHQHKLQAMPTASVSVRSLHSLMAGETPSALVAESQDRIVQTDCEQIRSRINNN